MEDLNSNNSGHPTGNVSDMAPVAGVPLHEDRLDSGRTVITDLTEVGHEDQNHQVKRFIAASFHDAWAAVVFVIYMVVCLAIGVARRVHYTTPHAAASNGTVVGAADDSQSDISAMLGSSDSSGLSFAQRCVIIVGVALVVAVAVLHGVKRWLATATIVGLHVTSYVLTGAIGIAIFMSSDDSGSRVGAACICLVAVALGGWLYWSRHRIALARILIATSARVLLSHVSLVALAAAVQILLILTLLLWCWMWLPFAVELSDALLGDDDGGSDEATFRGSIATSLILLFGFLWATQAFVDWLHVTVCGVAATWYFSTEERPLDAETTEPHSDTSIVCSSATRALTSSFGSICLGSLFNAVIEFIHFVAGLKGHDPHHFHNSHKACTSVVPDTVMTCASFVMERFNQFAFVHVAVYGYSYSEAARRTWALAQGCAATAIFNDVLVQMTLDCAALWIAAVVACVVGFLSDVLSAVLAFLMVWTALRFVTFRTLRSIAVTLFVCFAEQPQILEMRAPELNRAIVEAIDRIACQSQQGSTHAV